MIAKYYPDVICLGIIFICFWAMAKLFKAGFVFVF